MYVYWLRPPASAPATATGRSRRVAKTAARMTWLVSPSPPAPAPASAPFCANGPFQVLCLTNVSSGMNFWAAHEDADDADDTDYGDWGR